MHNTQPTQTPLRAPTVAKKPNKPNDCGTISVTGFVKIFDPLTKQVFVETRA